MGLSRYAAASGASLYLSPAIGTFYVGETFDVSILLNTDDNIINVVQADLRFSADKLQIVSPTAGRSFVTNWISQPTYSNSAGTASFRGGIANPGIKTSSGLISTITFKITSPGTGYIYFADSSRILLNDGQGTDILEKKARGEYILTVKPPEGPQIYSTTHPDPDVWYKNNNSVFSWDRQPGMTDFSFSLDQDPQGVPDNASDTKEAQAGFSDLMDGVWYFHLKAAVRSMSSGLKWGGISHYAVKIDRTSPVSFMPEIKLSGILSPQRYLYFETVDAASGIAHYELKILDLNESEQNKYFFTEEVSPHKLDLAPGKYKVIVRAIDKAGNYRDQEISLSIWQFFTIVGGHSVKIFGFTMPLPYFYIFCLILIALVVYFVYKLLIKRNLRFKLRKDIDKIEETVKEDKELIEKKIEEVKELKEEFEKEIDTLEEIKEKVNNKPKSKVPNSRFKRQANAK